MDDKEKARRYDEAIEGIQEILNSGQDSIKMSRLQLRLQGIFPELKESENNEDEKIKEQVVYAINQLHVCECTKNKLITWVEKRGEQKPADKVEPKFKVGDKIRKKTPSSFDRDMQVARIEKDYYVCNHIGKFSSEVVSFSKESSYELIEQKTDWSKEDKRKIDRIYSILRQAADTHAFSTTCRLIGDKECIELQDFLKSLKDRVGCEADCTTMWKPSDAQMARLKEACDEHYEIDGLDPLYTLYQDLQKLREE